MSATPLKVFAPTPATIFDAGPLTVAQVLDWYQKQAHQTGSPSAAVKERQRLWRMFAAAHGGELVENCRPALLLEWINTQSSRLSAWSRRRWNSTIQKPFNFAAAMGLIKANPFHGLSFPVGDEGRDWTDEEYRALLRNSRPYFRRLIVFIRFSGARPGEARSIQWPMVSSAAAAIVLKKHKTAHKTRLPRRIPLNSVLCKLLAFQKRHNPPPAAHAFLNALGNPWEAKVLIRRMAAVRQRAGLGRDVKMHGGRHYFATRAVMAGVDLATLSQLLGHNSPATTYRYVHLAGQIPHLNRAMEQAVKGDKAHSDSRLSLG